MPNQFWNVQPYRWMSELDANYTKGVLIVTRKAAKETAKEMEQWMKANAPWRDRSEEERERRGVKTPHARESLTAFVVYDPEDVKFEKSEIAEAMNRDFDVIAELNENQKLKREKAYNRVRILRSEGQRGAANRLKRNISTQRQYQYYNRKNLPKKYSHVATIEKWLKGQVAPFVEIHIQYDRDVTYARWLELAHGGRFSIIGRTMQQFFPKFMARVRSNMNLVQFRDTWQLDEPVSPEERFAEHVRMANNYLRGEGRPDYRPWSPEMKQEKTRRRGEYDPGLSKHFRTQREQHQSNAYGKVRRRAEVPYEHFSFNVRRSR